MEGTSLIKKASIFILSGHLLLGIGYIAFLPPWEGFDETAHYSSIQQIVDTGTIPRYGSSWLSAEVEEYVQFAPFPYNGSPPVEINGGYTYKSFFDSSKEMIERGAGYVRDRPQKPRYFVQGEKLNWQSQHPPLYYLIFTPVYSMTKNMSWLNQLFILRIISYFLAWMALVIGAFIYLKFLKSEDQGYINWILLGIGVWPLIFPSWFTDMARIGNDSLCALIISLIWMVLLRYKNHPTLFTYIFLGILLGIGCLVKAFFIPIVGGVVCYLLISHWVKRGREQLGVILIRIASMIFIILAISGWWYHLNWIDHGVVLGSDEMIRLKNAGGMIDNLVDNFSFTAWVRGHAAAITTFAWSGSWSFARPQYIFLAPMALMVVYLLYIYVSNLPGYQITMTEWLPVWLTLPVLMGLSYHVLVRIALIGEGRGTGGYYLHFLVVPLVMALGIGLKSIQAKKGFRITGYILGSYAVIFSIILFLTQILLYGGRLHISGNSKFYQLSTGFGSLFEFSEILSSLNVISYPYLGIIMLFTGGVLVGLGLSLIRRQVLQK